MESAEEKIKRHPFREDNRNENEKKVVNKLLEIYGDYPGQCWCNLCLNNIFCLALNALPPRYENAVIHNLLKKNSVPDEEVEQALRAAIKKVGDNPKGDSHHPGAE